MLLRTLPDDELKKLHQESPDRGSLSPTKPNVFDQFDESPGIARSAATGAVRGLGGAGDLRETASNVLAHSLERLRKSVLKPGGEFAVINQIKIFSSLFYIISFLT
jgi:hypothetical protein